MSDTGPLVNVVITMLPNVLALIRSWHHDTDPNAPTPSDADVLAALQSAVTSSIAKDDDWLRTHPHN